MSRFEMITLFEKHYLKLYKCNNSYGSDYTMDCILFAFENVNIELDRNKIIFHVKTDDKTIHYYLYYDSPKEAQDNYHAVLK